jgi:hypothetical protein
VSATAPAPAWALEELQKRKARLRDLAHELPRAEELASGAALERRTRRLLDRIRDLVAPGPGQTGESALLLLGQMRELLYAFDEPGRITTEVAALRQTIAEAEKLLIPPQE